MKGSVRGAYKNMVRDQVAACISASSTRLGRLRAWDHIATLAVSHFRIAEEAAKAERWFENIYVDRNDKARVVQMHMGSHPVGANHDGSLIVERGATVVMSQSATGTVVILLYPYESTTQSRSTPYLIWKLTDDPMTVKAGMLEALVKDFMTYARVSSVLFAPSFSDRERIAKLERRSLVLQEKLPKWHLGRLSWAVLLTGSATLLLTFGAWLWDARQGVEPSACYEPFAGLVALVTGWLTAGLRSQADAIKKTEIREEAVRAIGTEPAQPNMNVG